MDSGNQQKVEDHRKKWDRDHYALLAAERLQDEIDRENAKERLPPVKRELLKRRDYRVDLESKLGKSVVITKSTPSSQSGGYYCNVCDCVVKDSINFLDHINGKKHQRNLGMSMRVERSSLEQVQKRFEANKRKREDQKKEYDLASRVKEIKEEEDRLKEYRKEQKRAKKRLVDDDASGEGEDKPEKDSMAAIMGFSGFSSRKK